MAAFRRRTLFAAPLIISVAASCSKKDDPKEHITRNPPEPAGPTWKREWTVQRVDPHKCEAEEPFDCPAGAKCNPPPPRAIERPPGTSGKTQIKVAELPDGSCGIVPPGCTIGNSGACIKHKTPCPLPPGGKLPTRLVEIWLVEKDKTGDGCHAEEPVDCPPGKDCNPPSPMKIECPPGVLRDATINRTVRVGMLPDKTCALLPDDCKAVECVKDKTPCPK